MENFIHDTEAVKLAIESEFAKSRLLSTVKKYLTFDVIYQYIGTTHNLFVCTDYSVVRVNKKNDELNNCKCHSVEMFNEWIRSCDERYFISNSKDKTPHYFIPFFERYI